MTTTNTTDVRIKYPRFDYIFGRTVAMGQLFREGTEHQIATGSIAQLLEYASKEQLNIVNAQEILDNIVRKNGFAS